MQIAAIVGSLRAASFNRSVMSAAAGAMPDGVELVEVSIVDVPLFNQDVEEAGDPASVVAMKEAVAAADGLVFFTPEYNRSIPAVTKNALDWLSRPPGEGPLTGTPIGIVAASPGRHDAPGVREHLAATAAGAGGVVFDDSIGFGQIYNLVADGGFTDDDARATLTQWLIDFCDMVEAQRSK